MTESRRNWEYDELLMALNLYCRLAFGQFHSRNKEVISLAETINRTPSAVALKLSNFAHLDPTLKQKGASNTSKLDRQIWEEFWANPEEIITRSTELFEAHQIPDQNLTTLVGTDQEVVTKIRRNQSFFRRMILTAYKNRCCITGLTIPELLTASHILPWAEHHDKRLEPTNGLCLSATYDRAFDRYLISFDDDYRMIISPKLRKCSTDEATKTYFLHREGQQLILPHRFLPSKEYLAQHCERLQT